MLTDVINKLIDVGLNDLPAQSHTAQRKNWS